MCIFEETENASDMFVATNMLMPGITMQGCATNLRWACLGSSRGSSHLMRK